MALWVEKKKMPTPPPHTTPPPPRPPPPHHPLCLRPQTLHFQGLELRQPSESISQHTCPKETEDSAGRVRLSSPEEYPSQRPSGLGSPPPGGRGATPLLWPTVARL